MRNTSSSASRKLPLKGKPKLVKAMKRKIRMRRIRIFIFSVKTLEKRAKNVYNKNGKAWAI